MDRIEAEAKKPRGRGRPRPRTWAELMKGAREVALHVYSKEASDPRPGRGALTRAVRAVALARRMEEGTVRKDAYRHRALRELARSFHAFLQEGDEVSRRAAGMPEDVIAKVGGRPAGWVMRILRNHGPAHGCPRWFIDAVRNDEWDKLDLMSRTQRA